MRTTGEHRAELLPNGFIRVFDYGTYWAGLYNRDGSHRSGNHCASMDRAALAFANELEG